MPILLDQTIVLLGAGASLPAGIPLARGFVAAVEDYLKGLPPHDSGALLGAFHATCAAIAHEVGCKLSEIDIEQLYRSIDDALDVKFSAKDPLGPKPLLTASRALERLHYEIKRCILRHCLLTDGKKTSFFDPIAGELRNCRELPIVSLNYDNVVELFCRIHRIRYRDPVLQPSPGPNDQVVLIKLHGSVTWAIDKSGLPTIGAPYGRGALRVTGALRSATLETPIIYPTPGKVPVQMPFVGQVARLQELLLSRDATGRFKFQRCLAIGYSFRDRHVVDWFTSAFSANRDLRIVLVDLRPEKVLHALIRRDPRTDWTRRVLEAPARDTAAALKLGLSTLVNAATSVRPPSVTVRSGWPAMTSPVDSLTGMAAAPDGASVYLSTGAGLIEQHHLSSGRRVTVARGLRQNRGLATDPGGRLFFIQNQLWPACRVPTVGAGVVRSVDVSTGRLRTVNRVRLSDIRTLIAARFASRATRLVSSATNNLLSWPTDLAWSTHLNALLATESRGLAVIDPAAGSVRHIAGPPLTLNLHAISFLSPTLVLGLELGVAQSNSWGRLITFDLTRFAHGPDIYDLGLARLFGVCVLPSGRILVAQHFPSPAGSILVFDQPPTAVVKEINGFDFPRKLVHHPSWGFVLCSDRVGLHRIRISEFN